ncbi:MAG TPA: hypothetical protein VFU43_31045 [Streptosporangiaceae bacterium]|nr:hypothetical protein [Streptosporangiaceae bacterium]
MLAPTKRRVRRAFGQLPQWSGKARIWLAGVLAAALATALSGVFSDTLGTLGEAVTKQRSPSPSALAVAQISPVKEFSRYTGVESGMTFMFPQPPARLRPARPPLDPNSDPAAVYSWAKANGGVDVEDTVLYLIVTGRSRDAVVLTDFRVNVIDRKPPMKGSLVGVVTGGGPIATRHIEVNLDGPVPRIRLGDARESAGRGRTWSFPLRVSSSDPEVFIIWVRAASCDCRWTAELRYVVHEQQRVHRINDSGKPFRTTGVENATGKFQTTDGRTFQRDFGPTMPR